MTDRTSNPTSLDPSLLMDNAATASQCRELLDDHPTRQAVLLNVYRPLWDEIERLRAEVRTLNCHIVDVYNAQEAKQVETTGEHHGLDNARQVFFYEQDFYVLSNFSAFRLNFGSVWHDTSEHAYHWMKFRGADASVQNAIAHAESAHDAFKLAERYRDRRRRDWDAVKVDVMRDILRAKADQHEYVRRKLLDTGDRELIENSWRDDFWGWGPNRDGRNQLGKLWMEIRAELRSSVKSVCKPSASTDDTNASPSRPPSSSVECPKCRTQLAFEGDECWSCKENANAPINS